MDRWQAFNNRVRQEAGATLKNNKSGVCIISAHILVDHEGTPMVWVVSEGKRIEPSADALEVIGAILGD